MSVTQWVAIVHLVGDWPTFSRGHSLKVDIALVTTTCATNLAWCKGTIGPSGRTNIIMGGDSAGTGAGAGA